MGEVIGRRANQNDRGETIKEIGGELRTDISKKGEAVHVKYYRETQLGS